FGKNSLQRGCFVGENSFMAFKKTILCFLCAFLLLSVAAAAYGEYCESDYDCVFSNGGQCVNNLCSECVSDWDCPASWQACEENVCVGSPPWYLGKPTEFNNGNLWATGWTIRVKMDAPERELWAFQLQSGGAPYPRYDITEEDGASGDEQC